MLKVHPRQVVSGKSRRKAALLPLTEWKRVVAALEELDDIKAYDAAKAGVAETVPFEQTIRGNGGRRRLPRSGAAATVRPRSESGMVAPG
jgi:hypothetical protein